MVSRTLLLLALGLTAGCFRLDKADYDAATDFDGDGEVGTAFGGTDCNDRDAAIYAGATELCDGIDNNCDDLVDMGDVANGTTFYTDADGDGEGDASAPVELCALEAGFADNSDDCDDDNAAIHTGATESCNNIDDNCNGTVDEGESGEAWYRDADEDGFGDPLDTLTACTAPDGYVADDGDCNDADDTIHPDAAEVCDEVDNNCNDAIDDGEGEGDTFYVDADGDGYGNTDDAIIACTQPPDTVEDNRDCNDDNATVYPGATEICDGEDNDCDSVVDYEVNVPEHAATITEAISIASGSDRICVAPGIYEERLSLTRDLILEGQDPTITIIDADGASPAISIANQTDAALVRGFTVTGALGSEATVFYTDNAATVFEDLIVKDNIASNAGQCLGALGKHEGGRAPTFRRVDFIENVASCATHWGLFYNRRTEADLTFENTRFIANSMTGDDHLLGLTAAYVGGIVMRNVVITANEVHAAELGSADLQVRGLVAGTVVAASVELENVAIHANHIDTGTTGAVAGGLIYIDADSTATVVNTTISSNTITTSNAITASTFWGGVYATYSNFYDQQAPLYSGTNPSTLPGNITDDPLFTDVSAADPTDWDLTLQNGATVSTLIDAGDEDILDPDGTYSDIGAHGGPGADAW